MSNEDDLARSLRTLATNARTIERIWNQPNERGSTLRAILKMKRTIIMVETMHKHRCGWDDAMKLVRDEATGE